MTREIIFASAARLEFDEAILWYDDQQPGLGDEPPCSPLPVLNTLPLASMTSALVPLVPTSIPR